MGKVISMLLLMHLSLLEMKSLLPTGRKIIATIVVYIDANMCDVCNVPERWMICIYTLLLSYVAIIS